MKFKKSTQNSPRLCCILSCALLTVLGFWNENFPRDSNFTNNTLRITIYAMTNTDPFPVFCYKCLTFKIIYQAARVKKIITSQKNVLLVYMALLFIKLFAN